MKVHCHDPLDALHMWHDLLYALHMCRDHLYAPPSVMMHCMLSIHVMTHPHALHERHGTAVHMQCVGLQSK